MSNVVKYFFFFFWKRINKGFKDAREESATLKFLYVVKQYIFFHYKCGQFKNLNIVLYIKKTLKLIFDTFLYNEKKYLGQF